MQFTFSCQRHAFAWYVLSSTFAGMPCRHTNKWGSDLWTSFSRQNQLGTSLNKSNSSFAETAENARRKHDTSHSCKFFDDCRLLREHGSLFLVYLFLCHHPQCQVLKKKQSWFLWNTHSDLKPPSHRECLLFYIMFEFPVSFKHVYSLHDSYLRQSQRCLQVYTLLTAWEHV